MTLRHVLGLVSVAALLIGLVEVADAASSPDVATILARYERATRDPGAPEFVRTEMIGTIAGSGLRGAIHMWTDRDRDRVDQSLGPRLERTMRIGNRFWLADSDGDVRELTGVLVRRARTERFIDSGTFAKYPDRCTPRGRVVVGGRTAYALDIAALAGETQRVAFDAVTGLPLQVAYDDDDGQTTISFSDWRTVAKHRFPFQTIVSNGDHLYDTTETLDDVRIDPSIDPVVFTPFTARRIDMSAPQTIPIEYHEGHFFAPVTLAGRPYTFLLDTGAQNIVIDSRVAREVGLSLQGALEASGAARTGGLTLSKVDEIEIANGRLHDIVATSLDLESSTGGAFHIDGILGYPFFAATLVTLDFASRTMTLGAPGSYAPTGQRIDVSLDRALPEARLRLNESIDAPFIVDTGNAAELLLYRPFVNAHPGIVPFSQTSRSSYGIGGATASYRSTLDALRLGSTSLYHLDTDVMQATRGAFADRFDAGNVGLGVLRNFVVTFDFADAAMYLAPGTDFDDGRHRN